MCFFFKKIKKEMPMTMTCQFGSTHSSDDLFNWL